MFVSVMPYLKRFHCHKALIKSSALVNVLVHSCHLDRMGRSVFLLVVMIPLNQPCLLLAFAQANVDLARCRVFAES